MSFQYDIDFWDKMLRQNSPTAIKINKIRWNFIKPAKAKLVLDWGSGCGFFRAFRPQGIEVDTFDISPWPQTGIKSDKYDIITMWDVLEHIADLDKFFEQELKKITVKHIAISVPTLREELESEELTVWKHYKPGEHFQYKLDREWDEVFYKHGFTKVKSDWGECKIRTDIYSALFKKKT